MIMATTVDVSSLSVSMPRKSNTSALHPHTRRTEGGTKSFQLGVCKINTTTHPNHLASCPLALDRTHIVWLHALSVQAEGQATHVPASLPVAHACD